VVADICGLQTQYAPTEYIGLWSRLRNFERATLTRALEERRIIQGTLMRATIHMVAAEDYWPMAHAVRRPRREWWLRVARDQMAGTDANALSAAIDEALSDGPLRQRELADRLAWAGVTAGVSGVHVMTDLVRVPPSGTWERRRADLYALANAWIAEPPFDELKAVDHLVRRYLGGFGPATVKEIGTFAGLELSTVRASLERVAHRSFVGHDGAALVDLPDAPLPEEDGAVPVRFLGPWEALLLVHARRTEVLPEAFRGRVFNVRTPHSVNTFLVDGQVAGSWRYERGEVQLAPFRPLTRSEAAEVDREATRLAAFHGGGG
jgi:hypothetical protein